ncbi:MAG: response regulator [Silicimonas sp.]|nr:response regulator [Silicimonas sp.]
MVIAGMLVPLPGADMVFLGAGTGLFALFLLGSCMRAGDGFLHLRRDIVARLALRRQTAPALVTGSDARVLMANALAGRFDGVVREAALSEVLQGSFGSGARFVSLMSARVAFEGRAVDTIFHKGRRVRVEAERIAEDRVLWRFDERKVEAATDDPDDRVALICLDPDDRIVGSNPKARALLRDVPPTLEALAGGADVCSGDVIELCGKSESVRSTFVEIRNSDGWREAALLPAGEGDLTAADEILAEPGLLSALPVPMLKISAEGALLEANNAARAILSLEADTMPPLFELVEGMGRPIADWLADAINGRGLLKPEIVRTVRPGQEMFLQITLGRTIEDGQTVLVGILNDATELKTLEAQFVQSQKMQAIGQLAGGVAHDFNNLLTAISGHCDLLLLRHDPGDPDYADLIQISQNANRAASLVGQLLAFSRKQNLKPRALDLRDTMSDLAHLLNRLIGERIQLEVIHAPGDQVIRADRRQMEQVIVNLVVNARDAMRDGGRITVTIRRQALDDPLVRDRAHVPPGDYVVIEVEDTGTGIAPDGISKIFEPFYTTKKTGEGTGLGLSTAYGIVKQSGGYIFADSTPGQGAQFSLYFPSHETPEDSADEERAAKPALAPAHGGGVILLVEDEAPVRAFASRALRMRGYTVLEAENAEQALETLEDPDLHVDVFLTDVIMPGLDGPTWVRRALRQRPGTRTVFVSGYSEEGRAEKQARIPNSVFLPKPFSLQQLTAVVNEQFQ